MGMNMNMNVAYFRGFVGTLSKLLIDFDDLFQPVLHLSHFGCMCVLVQLFSHLAESTQKHCMNVLTVRSPCRHPLHFVASACISLAQAHVRKLNRTQCKQYVDRFPSRKDQSLLS
jgi:hypothetical protein